MWKDLADLLVYVMTEPIVLQNTALIWKMYTKMKKLLLIALILFGIVSSIFAEKTSEVTLRFSRQENTARIVFESEEDIIRNVNTIASLSSVRIEFPVGFEIRKPGDFIFETVKKDRLLVINLKDVADIKAYKLSAPPRLVIDLKLAPRPQSWTTPPAMPKQQKDPSQKPEQKAAPWTTQQTSQKQPAGPPSEKQVKVKTVVIDPGHGGYDYGITSQETREKDMNLVLARDLSNALSKKGYVVFLTRKVDQSLTLTDRVNFSTGRNPDLFISLHAASTANFVIYLSTIDDLNIDAAVKLYSLSSRQARHVEKSRAAGKAIGESIKKEFGTNVVQRELPLPVLNAMNSPALLLEYPLLKSYATDQKLRDKFTGSVLKGIAAYEQ